jgi:hypothetical protein
MRNVYPLAYLEHALREKLRLLSVGGIGESCIADALDLSIFYRSRGWSFFGHLEFDLT